MTALPSVIPSRAYASDIARLERPSIGSQDDACLVLAQALSRFGQLSPEEQHVAAPTMADAVAVNALAAGLQPSSMIMRAASALRVVHEAGVRLPSGEDAVTDLVIATQGVAEELEIAGGFELAFAMLNGLVTSFASLMSSRLHGNVLAHQGRAVRQLGALDVAVELYADACDIGLASGCHEVIARALMGRGVISVTRRNYPSARGHFERALWHADVAIDPELIRAAHHGLLNCGFASGDLDAAMVHGWNVLRLCIAPDSRAEALMNMAEICRLTGEHDAAMRVYAVVVGWSSVARVRLHASSGGLQSAIASGRLAEARRFANAVAELLPTAADSYTRAIIGIEFADSLRQMGDPSATQRLAEAQALAVECCFHELVHRAELALDAWRDSVPPQLLEAAEAQPYGRRQSGPARSEHFRTVLRSLNGLTAAVL